MNSLIRFLSKTSLIKGELDNHLVACRGDFVTNVGWWFRRGDVGDPIESGRTLGHLVMQMQRRQIVNEFREQLAVG
jgi:hypothetical protein